MPGRYGWKESLFQTEETKLEIGIYMLVLWLFNAVFRKRERKKDRALCDILQASQRNLMFVLTRHSYDFAI